MNVGASDLFDIGQSEATLTYYLNLVHCLRPPQHGLLTLQYFSWRFLTFSGFRESKCSLNIHFFINRISSFKNESFHLVIILTDVTKLYFSSVLYWVKHKLQEELNIIL